MHFRASWAKESDIFARATLTVYQIARFLYFRVKLLERAIIIRRIKSYLNHFSTSMALLSDSTNSFQSDISLSLSLCLSVSVSLSLSHSAILVQRPSSAWCQGGRQTTDEAMAFTTRTTIIANFQGCTGHKSLKIISFPASH